MITASLIIVLVLAQEDLQTKKNLQQPMETGTYMVPGHVGLRPFGANASKLGPEPFDMKQFILSICLSSVTLDVQRPGLICKSDICLLAIKEAVTNQIRIQTITFNTQTSL